MVHGATKSLGVCSSGGIGGRTVIRRSKSKAKQQATWEWKAAAGTVAAQVVADGGLLLCFGQACVLHRLQWIYTWDLQLLRTQPLETCRCAFRPFHRWVQNEQKTPTLFGLLLFFIRVIFLQRRRMHSDLKIQLSYFWSLAPSNCVGNAENWIFCINFI